MKHAFRVRAFKSYENGNYYANLSGPGNFMQDSLLTLANVANIYI
jgi:hypothetical protein